MKEPKGPSPAAHEGDRFAGARAIADAVLYEGYVLYPYRASSRKNQLRWQFGVLVPRAFSEADGSERWSARTECLVEPDVAPVLRVRIRCLQVQHRFVEAATSSGDFTRVDQLDVDGQRYVGWDEAIDRFADLAPQALGWRDGTVHEEPFGWEGGTDVEPLRAGGAIVGRVVRQRRSIEGRALVTVSDEGPSRPWAKVTVTVENTTPWAVTSARRDEVMDLSLVAVHTMLAVDGGRFVSLLDPPEAALPAVAECHNEGTFPVLVGADDDIVLSSPIILYDHPEVAPESAGDLYDATEIDEILALRVLTLTDDEKFEARGTDPRAAAIIDRVDDFTPEMWERMHGTVRPFSPVGSYSPVRPFSPTARASDGPASEPGVPGQPGVQGAPSVPWWDPAADSAVDPWADSVVVAGVEVKKGTRVRLHPSHRSDAQDLFLHDVAATVAGVFTDVDGDQHVAVTVDDDPATEELSWQGRYLFFHPDEVEPDPDEVEPDPDEVGPVPVEVEPLPGQDGPG